MKVGRNPGHEVRQGTWGTSCLANSNQRNNNIGFWIVSLDKQFEMLSCFRRDALRDSSVKSQECEHIVEVTVYFHMQCDLRAKLKHLLNVL